MQGAFKKIDKGVDRLGYWFGAYTLLSAALTWLWKQVTAFGAIGWSEAVLLGLGAGCVIMLALSLTLSAWRYFKPLPKPAAQTVPPARVGPSIKPDSTISEGNSPGAECDLSIKLERGRLNFSVGDPVNVHDVTIYPTRPSTFLPTKKAADRKNEEDEDREKVHAIMESIANTITPPKPQKSGDWESEVVIHVVFTKPVADPYVSLEISKSTENFSYKVEEATSRYCAVSVKNFEYPCHIWIHVQPRGTV